MHIDNQGAWVADPYRNQAPDTATIEELRAEVERLREKCSRKESREERRKRRAEWWDRNNSGDTSVPPLVVAIPVCLALVAAVVGGAFLQTKNTAAYHSSSVACIPGTVDHWRMWDERVICTSGYIRWVVER